MFLAFSPLYLSEAAWRGEADLRLVSWGEGYSHLPQPPIQRHTDTDQNRCARVCRFESCSRRRTCESLMLPTTLASIGGAGRQGCPQWSAAI